MGSKRTMLQNGLGSLILDESKKVSRIVDLFCGAGSVVRFAAENTACSVLAIDLQNYSVILARSILSKVAPMDPEKLSKKWIQVADKSRRQSRLWHKSKKLSAKIDMRSVRSYVERSRELCTENYDIGPIWNAYGGHYFSPEQALTFDYLLSNLPHEENEKITCQAAILTAAMRCIASPGHTAQPLQPTITAKRFIIESWKRDPIEVCKSTLNEVSKQYAKKLGNAYVGDAVNEANNLRSSDLVFVDPPYTGVQYSRFYHVLETLSRGYCESVSGVGRYPPLNERPQSTFSNISQSIDSLINLLNNLSHVGATVIFTFPEGESSNGLSGKLVEEIAYQFYSIDKKIVKGRFSTLGGNKDKRDSRKDSSELILLMRPR